MLNHRHMLEDHGMKVCPSLPLGRPGPVDGAVAWCARAGLECLERDQMTDRQQNELICCVLFKVETDTCLY